MKYNYFIVIFLIYNSVHYISTFQLQNLKITKNGCRRTSIHNKEMCK